MKNLKLGNIHLEVNVYLDTRGGSDLIYAFLKG